MVISILVLLLGISFARWDLRKAIFVAILLLPLFIVRLELLNVPSNLFELFTGGVVLVFLLGNWRQAIGRGWQLLQFFWLPLILIAIGLLLGTVSSPDILSSLGIVKSWFILPVVMAVMLVTVFERKDIPDILGSLVASGALLALGGYYQLFSGSYLTTDHRLSSWFVSANYLAMYLVPMVFLLVPLKYAENSSRYLPRNSVHAFMLALALPIFLTFSYGGWFGLMAGAGFLAIALGGRKLAAWLGGIGGVAVLAIVSQLFTPRFQAMLDPSRPSSLTARLQTWATDWLMIKSHPFTGIGLGTYEQQYLSYARQLFDPPQETYMLHAHNLFLQTAIYLGVIGFAGFLALFFRLWQLLRQNWNITGMAVGAAFVSMAAHGLVDTTYFKNDLAVLFWLLVAVAFINSRSFTRPQV